MPVGAALVRVLILLATADVRLVSFNRLAGASDGAAFINIVRSRAEPMKQEPRALIADVENAMQLVR
jgi:hypothetical protein